MYCACSNISGRKIHDHKIDDHKMQQQRIRDRKMSGHRRPVQDQNVLAAGTILLHLQGTVAGELRTLLCQQQAARKSAWTGCP